MDEETFLYATHKHRCSLFMLLFMLSGYSGVTVASLAKRRLS